MDNQSSTPRRGRARERVQRRREQATTGKAPLPGLTRLNRPARPASRHLNIPRPNSRLKIPRINISIDRVGLYLVGSVVIVVLVVVVLGRIRNRPAEGYPNALWISNDWTYSESSETALTAFADRLRENQIGTVYAWVSQLQPDGSWFGGASFDSVRGFAEGLKAVYPDVDIFGWINIPAVPVEPSVVQTAVADLSERVIGELGFDGVFLNVDPVLNRDENFLALLRAVRASIGVDVPLGAAVPPDWTPEGASIPLPPQIAPGTVWDEPYKQSVALLVNQVVVRTYNAGFTNPADYSTWVAYQVGVFTEAVAELDAGTSLYFGLPTYDGEAGAVPRFDPTVENIASAAAGVEQGLTDAGENADFVAGVAIYGDWTTDEQEWQLFRRAWLER